MAISINFLPYPFRCHLHPFDCTVFIVKQAIDTDRTAETATERIDSAVVVNHVPVSFEFDDSLVVGITVTGKFIQEAFIFPRSVDIAAHRITHLFGKFGSV